MNNYFYRHCQKNNLGKCENSNDHCGVQFTYMMGSDTTAIDAFLNNINYLSCQLLSPNYYYANADDDDITIGATNSSDADDIQSWAPGGCNTNWFEPSLNHVDIGHMVLGGLIVILVAIMVICSCRGKQPKQVFCFTYI